jgi:phosphate/phosphite/phosphonate ABC transporter binding protein
MATRRAWLVLALLAALGCDEAVRAGPERAEPKLELPEGGTDPDKLRVGVTPHSGPDTVELYEPLFRHLARALGRPIAGVTADSYDGLAGLVNDRSVDVGIFSPLAYVKARRSLAAVPIATATREGSPTYVGYLVTRGSWPPPALDGLKGKRIAWVDRSSTSGWLYPRALLRERGFDPDGFFASSPTFADNHTAAVRMVIGGDVDVAAVASPFVDPGPRSVEEADALLVVAKTRRIPLDAVVVRNDLRRELGVQIQKALLKLHDAPEASELHQSWGVNGFVRPDGRYDEIARLDEEEPPAASP